MLKKLYTFLIILLFCSNIILGQIFQAHIKCEELKGCEIISPVELSFSVSGQIVSSKKEFVKFQENTSTFLFTTKVNGLTNKVQLSFDGKIKLPDGSIISSNKYKISLYDKTGAKELGTFRATKSGYIIDITQEWWSNYLTANNASQKTEQNNTSQKKSASYLSGLSRIKTPYQIDLIENGKVLCSYSSNGTKGFGCNNVQLPSTPPPILSPELNTLTIYIYLFLKNMVSKSVLII